MIKNLFTLIVNKLVLVPLILLSAAGCSTKDESNKNLPPVPNEVHFTPSETSKITPVGLDGK